MSDANTETLAGKELEPVPTGFELIKRWETNCAIVEQATKEFDRAFALREAVECEIVKWMLPKDAAPNQKVLLAVGNGFLSAWLTKKREARVEWHKKPSKKS